MVTDVLHVETRRRLVRRIPAEGLDPRGYGIDVFLFASRHLIVVCTQTYIFRCCIVLRQLYADCMRCCILSQPQFRQVLGFELPLHHVKNSKRKSKMGEKKSPEKLIQMAR